MQQAKIDNLQAAIRQWQMTVNAQVASATPDELEGSLLEQTQKLAAAAAAAAELELRGLPEPIVAERDQPETPPDEPEPDNQKSKIQNPKAGGGGRR